VVITVIKLVLVLEIIRKHRQAIAWIAAAKFINAQDADIRSRERAWSIAWINRGVPTQ
jgi:hypothetical protein